LNGTCALQLIVRGRVVRTGQHLIAVAIDKHEFRTRGCQAFPATQISTRPS
jgi:hypothetical protein